MTKIFLIVAADTYAAIGKDGKMPWHLPKDLQWFRQNTIHETVIMGRKTFESIGSRPLDGRRNIVVSKTLEAVKDVEVVSNIRVALELCDREKIVWVIGGAEIFKQTLHLADRLYITVVDTEVEGATAFFPEFNHKEWKVTYNRKEPADQENPFGMRFVVLER